MEKHTVSDGMVENLKGMARAVRPPDAFTTGVRTEIELFDNNLSAEDRILLTRAVNNSVLGDFETVQRYLETASDEDRKALEVEVANFKYCIDEVAKKAALKSIVIQISRM